MEDKQMLLVSDGERECLIDVSAYDDIPAELSKVVMSVSYSDDGTEIKIVGRDGAYTEDDEGYLVKRLHKRGQAVFAWLKDEDYTALLRIQAHLKTDNKNAVMRWLIRTFDEQLTNKQAEGE